MYTKNGKHTSCMNRDYPDWSEFAVKYKGACRERFEDLCRMLFCEELGIDQGSLVSVKNQAGNETMLVQHEGQFIGFQCKYFDKKYDFQQFKDSIFKAKFHNQDQDVIYLYSNEQLPSEEKEEELVAYVEKQGMKCEIRFHKQILDRVNYSKECILYDTFFRLGSEAESLVAYGLERTWSYLKDIHTVIPFKEGITISRDMELEILQKSLAKDKIVFVIGHGGCGKSCLVKFFLNQLGSDVAVRIYRGERFNKSTVHEMLGIAEHLFFDAYKPFEEKYFIVDSSEQIVLRNDEGDSEIAYLFRMLQTNNWKVILTCRKESASMLSYFLQERLDTSIETVEVDRLSEQELLTLSKQYGFNMPDDPHLRDYIRLPMELKEYLNKEAGSSHLSFSEYKRKEWNEKICGEANDSKDVQKARESVILNLAKILYLDGEESVFVDSSDNKKILQCLVKDQVLIYDEESSSYRFSHDLYGEWAVMELLERSYKNLKSLNKLFEEYNKTVTSRRCFRQWVSERLCQISDVNQEVCDIVKAPMQSTMQNEIIIAVLQAESIATFVDNNKRILLENHATVLKKLLFWLRISCVFINKDELMRNSSSNIIPNGKSWNCIIGLIYNRGIDFWRACYYDILPVILQWSRANEQGLTTRQCGEIALELLSNDSDHSLIYYEVVPVVYYASCELSDRAEAFIRPILDESSISGGSLEWYVLEYAVMKCDVGNYRMTKTCPKLMMDIWNYCWHGRHIEREQFSFGRYALYGLDKSFYIRTSGSTFQTSIVYLLLSGTEFVLDFLPDFFNRAINTYRENAGETNALNEVDIEVGGVTVTQWENEELWCAYRNRVMSNVPDIIVSMLIDLQWYLDNVVKSGMADCEFLRNLIRQSNNVMITAVVSAVALKHLDTCRELANELSMSARLKQLDKHRWATEYDSHDVNSSVTLSVRTTFYERELQLREQMEKLQMISLDNYVSGDIRKPISSYEAIMNGASMERIKWLIDTFKDTSGSLSEAKRLIGKVRDELGKYQELNLLSQIYTTHVDGVAPAYILLCDTVDEDAEWCKDFILHIYEESGTLYNPAALYDGIGYCVKVLPRLLKLFPLERNRILNAFSLLCVNIRDRMYENPLDEIVVKTIREGELWEHYEAEMKEFFSLYVSLCKERSRKLLPREVSMALRILPPQDMGIRMTKLRKGLVDAMFSYGEDDLNKGYVSARELSEPIAETVFFRGSVWIRMYTRYRLKRSVCVNRVSEAFLIGLIHEMEIIGDIDVFFKIWSKLAQRVFGKRRKNDDKLWRLKSILTFQENDEVLEKIKGKAGFMERCYEYMNMLVSKYSNEADVLKGLMLMTEYCEDEKLNGWITLIYQMLRKTNNSVVTIAGLSRMEDVMRRYQNVIGNKSLCAIGKKVEMEEILNVMVRCGSARAYFMKELIM